MQTLSVPKRSARRILLYMLILLLMNVHGTAHATLVPGAYAPDLRTIEPVSNWTLQEVIDHFRNPQYLNGMADIFVYQVDPHGGDELIHPYVLYDFRKGDCEDFAFFFLEMARLVGAPPEGLFVHVLVNGDVGHAIAEVRAEHETAYFDLTLGIEVTHQTLMPGGELAGYRSVASIPFWVAASRIGRRVWQGDPRYAVNSL